MKRVKLKRRAFVVLVAALVLSANTLSAQGGLFKRGAVAEENVATGVACDAQFRKDDRRDARLGRLAGEPSHLFCIRRGIP